MPTQVYAGNPDMLEQIEFAPNGETRFYFEEWLMYNTNFIMRLMCA